MSIESYSIKKSQCPRCAEDGNDTRKDNFHLYSDGHSYCFACGFYVFGSRRPRPQAEAKALPSNFQFNIPDDATTDIAFEAMCWLGRDCHLTQSDIIHNKILWSPRYLWLIFPIEYEGTTLGFQARNFNKQKPYKWFTKFNKKDLLRIYGKPTQTLVLVEDIVSAIRISKYLSTAPLFGAMISDRMFLKIKTNVFDQVKIWLDQDKVKEALLYAQRARELGINASCILTEEDPKCHTNQELVSILGISSNA
jgi:hypothetical protein